MDSLSVKEGFQVELLYSVPKETQGSWVAMTVDPRGRIIAADQYGRLYRFDPRADEILLQGTVFPRRLIPQPKMFWRWRRGEAKNQCLTRQVENGIYGPCLYAFMMEISCDTSSVEIPLL